MTDEELIEIADDWRAGILGARSSRSMCAAVSWPLQGYLASVCGFHCEAIEVDLGEMNHVFLRLPDGRVLDATLDQFNHLFAETFPAIYLGPPTKYHTDAPQKD